MYSEVLLILRQTSNGLFPLKKLKMFYFIATFISYFYQKAVSSFCWAKFYYLKGH